MDKQEHSLPKTEENASEKDGLGEAEQTQALCKDETEQAAPDKTETQQTDSLNSSNQTETVLVEKNNGNPFEMQVETKNKPLKETDGWKAFKKLLNYIFIDGLSGMAVGLFATLIIGTIVAKIGALFPIAFGKYLIAAGQVAQFMMGAGIALGMGYKLKKSPLVSVSAGVVGMVASFAARFIKGTPIVFLSLTSAGSYSTTVGEPLCAFIAAFVALEVGSLVSGKTKLDIILTPLVSVLSGILVAFLLGYPIDRLMFFLSNLVRESGEQQPFLMGVLVAVLMGVFLTLPISSAAIGVMLGLDGIVAGAAVVGCCTHMVGYAVMSFKENKWGGLVAQGVGTSMLQMPNLVKKPILWLPPVIASAILGPIATCVLHITCTPVGSGMGTAGLVGVIETFTAMTAGGTAPWIVLLEILGIEIIAPALLCLLISEIMRKAGWIQYGDLKLNLEAEGKK